MMYAVVSHVDGFGADTCISGIYITYAEALSHCGKDFFGYPDKIAKIDFGELNLDYYELPEIN